MSITETTTGYALEIDGEHMGTFASRFEAQKAIHTFRTMGVIIHNTNEDQRYGTSNTTMRMGA